MEPQCLSLALIFIVLIIQMIVFVVTRSFKNMKKEAIFESSYSNNFAKAEGLDTKPATPGRSHVGLRARRSTDLLVCCSACLIDGGRSIAVGR